MRFVDIGSSLLKTAVAGKNCRLASTPLIFKCLTLIAVIFYRIAYKQSSQKKDFFEDIGLWITFLLTSAKRLRIKAAAISAAGLAFCEAFRLRRLSKEKYVRLLGCLFSGIFSVESEE